VAIKLADMYVDLDLRTSGYAAELGAVTSASSKAGKAQGALTKKSTGAAAAFGKLSTAAKYGGAIMGSAVVLGAWKGANAASDLTEAINKVDQVFGKSSKSIKKWSEDSATKLLVSQSAALDAAGSFGAMLKPMGFTEKRAAAMSKRMVQLSADMASFNNVDPTDMLDRIQSGLSGEMEPLKRFGSVLSETRVAQYAYKTGLADTGDELTEQQKILGRYGLLLSDTKDQQGDVARTGDGMANSLRTLGANLTNLAAKLGSVLTPVVAGASNALNDFLGSILSGKGAARPEWIDSILGAFQDFGRSEVWRQITSGVSSIAEEFAKFWQDDGQAIIAAFRNIGVAIRWVVENWIIPVAERYLPPFFDAVRGIVKVVRGVVEVVSGILTGNWSKAWGGLKNVASGALEAMWGVVRAVTAPGREALSRIGDLVRTVLGGAWRAVVGIAKGAVDKLLGFWSSLLNATASVVEKMAIIPVIGDKFDGLADDIRGSADEIDAWRDRMMGRTDEVNKISLSGIRGQLRSTKGALEATREALGWWGLKFHDVFHGAGEDAKKGSDKSRDALSSLSGKLRDSERDTGRWGTTLTGVMGKITKKSARMALATASNVAAMGDAAAGPGGGIDTLVSSANKALSGLGVAKAKFVTYTPKKSGGGNPNVQFAQTGGIMVPGSGSGDKIPAMLEPGEVVWNRNAVRRMGGAQRANSINRKIRRHGPQHFAGGGIVPGDTGGLHAGILGLVSSLYKRFGGSVTSGLRAADSGSLHSTGQAADYVPADWKGASAAVNRIGGSLLEGIYNPGSFGGSPVSWDTGARVPSSFWGSEWGNHLDHIHLAVADGTKAAVSGMAREIREVLMKGPKGGLLNVGNAVLGRVREAANAYIARVAPAGYVGDGHTGALGGWKPGDVLRGRVSYFTGAGMAGGKTASTTPGLALNISPGSDAGWDNPTTRAWVAAEQMFRVRVGGKTADLPVEDLGPAGFTNRAIDVTAPGVAKMGFNPVSSFPTDSIGTATMLRRGGIVYLSGGGDPAKAKPKGDEPKYVNTDGDPWKKGDGKKIQVAEAGFSEGSFYLDRLKKVAERIKRLGRKRALTAEKITNAEDDASRPHSEAGTDTGPKEYRTQIRLNEHLLAMLRETRDSALGGIARAKDYLPHTVKDGQQFRAIEQLSKNWRGVVRDMQGLTGDGGEIRTLRSHLAELRYGLKNPGDALTNTDAVNELQAERIANLERALAVSQAQYGVFAGGFARGGRIPAGAWGLVGENGIETVSGPATVSPGAPEIRVVIEDNRTRVLVDGREVKAEVSRQLNGAARSKRYAGSGSLTTIGR